MPIRTGVAGIGVFGEYHANKYEEAEGAMLVALFDKDKARVQEAASIRKVEAFWHYHDFLAAVEAVTIAAPATVHGPLGEEALKAGKSVLIEKPIALDVAQATRMIKIAHQNGLVLQIGHQERYVAHEMGILEKTVLPLQVTSRRLNTFSGRAMDVSVVFDLMIHDLDLLLQYKPGAVQKLDVAAQCLYGEKADYVKADITFSSGLKACLEAGRIGQSPIRDMRLDFEAGPLIFNFLDRTIDNIAGVPLAYTFDSTAPPLALTDPLLWGTQSFIDAIVNGYQPQVSGSDGLAALELALLIENQAALT